MRHRPRATCLDVPYTREGHKRENTSPSARDCCACRADVLGGRVHGQAPTIAGNLDIGPSDGSCPIRPAADSTSKSRVLAPHLARTLGTDVAVDNVSGAGGLVGAKAIRDAAADGHTIGVVNGSGLQR